MIHLYKAERWFYLHHIPFLPKLFQGLIFLLFNSKVTADTEIGEETYFVCRGISTVRKFPYRDVPCIGDRVWIGPNVVVAGILARVIGHTRDLDYDLFTNPKNREGTASYMEDKNNIERI